MPGPGSVGIRGRAVATRARTRTRHPPSGTGPDRVARMNAARVVDGRRLPMVSDVAAGARRATSTRRRRRRPSPRTSQRAAPKLEWPAWRTQSRLSRPGTADPVAAGSVRTRRLASRCGRPATHRAGLHLESSVLGARQAKLHAGWRLLSTSPPGDGGSCRRPRSMKARYQDFGAVPIWRGSECCLWRAYNRSAHSATSGE